MKKRRSLKHRKKYSTRTLNAYLYLLWLMIIRQPSTWIYWALLLILPLCAGIFSAGVIKGLPAIFGAVLMAISFVCLVVLIVQKTIVVFKENEAFGVEILLTTKPITRNQLVFAKVLILFLFSTFASLSLFVSTVLGVVANNALNPDTQPASPLSSTLLAKSRLNMTYAAQMLGAAFGLCLLFGSITCFVSFFVSRKLALAIPILSFIGMDTIALVTTTTTIFNSKGSNAANFLNAMDDAYAWYVEKEYNPFKFIFDLQGDLHIYYQVTSQVVQVPPEELGNEENQHPPTVAEATSYVEKLWDLWSQNESSGTWYVAMKWMNLATPLLMGMELFSPTHQYTQRYYWYKGMEDPNYRYAAYINQNWQQPGMDQTTAVGNGYPVMTIYKAEAPAPAWGVITLWSVIAVSLLTASWFLYLRRDLK